MGTIGDFSSEQLLHDRIFVVRQVTREFDLMTIHLKIVLPAAPWPGLLEAWLVLTSVKYHGNLYILIPLNQRLALTRLRATGPWTRSLTGLPQVRQPGGKVKAYVRSPVRIRKGSLFLRICAQLFHSNIRVTTRLTRKVEGVWGCLMR